MSLHKKSTGGGGGVTIEGGLVPLGAYNAGTNYAVGDSVDYNGSSYVMYSDAAAGTVPTNTTYWQVVANKGDTGSAGSSGADGADGDDGATGPQGIQGIQGDTGAQGPQGVKGDTGDQGIQGIQGATGAAGNDGADGAQGIQGIQGVQGDAGADGSDGSNGSDGSDGLNVLNGTIDPTTEGVDGEFYINTTSNEIFGPKTGGSWGSGTSIVGPQGSQGTQGIQGIQGIQGDTGSTGPAGAKGDTGDTGSQGPQGIQGIQGDAGADGSDGAQGDQGIQGIQGIQGATGNTGPAGSDGADGADGADAVTSDAAYGAGWNGDTDAGSKNAIYDQLEKMRAVSISILQMGYPSTSSGSNVVLRSQGNVAMGSAVDRGYLMTRPGSIVGVSAIIDINSYTSGNVIMRSRINGTDKLQCQLSSPNVSNGQTAYATQARGVDTFVAGDIITIERNLSGTATTDDMIGTVEVVFDE